MNDRLPVPRERNGRQVESLSYPTGRTERDRSTVSALAALLSRVTGRVVSEEQVQALARESLAETLFAAPSSAGVQAGDYEILRESGQEGEGVGRGPAKVEGRQRIG